jgi:hypothetical protein
MEVVVCRGALVCPIERGRPGWGRWRRRRRKSRGKRGVGERGLPIQPLTFTLLHSLELDGNLLPTTVIR